MKLYCLKLVATLFKKKKNLKSIGIKCTRVFLSGIFKFFTRQYYGYGSLLAFYRRKILVFKILKFTTRFYS